MARDFDCVEDERYFERQLNDEVGSSEEQVTPSRKKHTGAKKSKGKKVALTLLLIGGIAAGTLFATHAVHSINETRRVDTLINNYTVENYVTLPSNITSNRSYDVTLADGEKVKERLEKNNVEYININGNFYTREGIDIELLTIDVTTTEKIAATRITSDGQTLYVAPYGYTLSGSRATRDNVERRTFIVPAGTDLNLVSFPGATSWEIVGEPTLIHTLPYSNIEESMLICDVPDGATLDEYNQCVGTLDLAPRKR